MSLWNKRLSEIDFSDIDDFCSVGYPEGVQLDYKREMPNDLTKLVCAFANTRGGLILLGVDADQTTNKPNWPCAGMPSEKGLSEKITAKCRDGIYPPVLPEISSPIEDPSDPGKLFLVVRVDESTTAPHSIRNGTKVYTRTGDMNKPVDLMHIDRLEMLLERRKQPERFREELLSRQVARARRKLRAGFPFFWWHLSPEFPQNPICTTDDCRFAIDYTDQHRVPDGYWGLANTNEEVGKDNFEQVIASTTKFGELFVSREFITVEGHEYLPGGYIAWTTLDHLRNCEQFYNKPNVQNPGMLRFSIGCERVEGIAMKPFRQARGMFYFIDETYRIDRTTTLETLSDRQSRQYLAHEMMSELFHAFGLTEPPLAKHWE